MRSDVMKHYGLTRDLPRSGYFETEQLREVLLDRGDRDAAQAIPAGAGRFMPFAAHHLDAFDGLWAEDIAWLQNRADTRIRFSGGASGRTDLNRFAGRTAR